MAKDREKAGGLAIAQPRTHTAIVTQANTRCYPNVLDVHSTQKR